MHGYKLLLSWSARGATAHRLMADGSAGVAALVAAVYFALAGVTSTAHAGFYIEPTVAVRQLSVYVGPRSDRYFGYPQISLNGSTVYFIRGYSSEGQPYSPELMRWRANEPLNSVAIVGSQQWPSSVSRLSMNWDGTTAIYRSPVNPDGNGGYSVAHLYLIKDGQPISELYGDAQYEVRDPFLVPDGSAVLFSSAADIGGVNPRHEVSGYRFDMGTHQVSGLVTYEAPSAGSYANNMNWAGVSTVGRHIFYSTGNWNNLNSSNLVSWFALDGGTISLLTTLTPSHFIMPLDPSRNLERVPLLRSAVWYMLGIAHEGAGA